MMKNVSGRALGISPLCEFLFNALALEMDGFWGVRGAADRPMKAERSGCAEVSEANECHVYLR